MVLVNGMNGTVYGSYKDGSDIYKDSKGYYIFQYNIKLDKEYKNICLQLETKRRTINSYTKMY